MKKIEINIPQKETYSVYIGRNIFEKLNKFANAKKLPANVFAVIDKKAYSYHQEKIDAMICPAALNARKLFIKPSEKIKTTESLNRIYSALQKYNFTRDSLLIAIGGGIVGDITGFAAATYNRGIKFIQVPTTLLAAVDSSVGGKTGINFGSTKNCVGSFYQPEFVVADTEFYDTLPQEELLCGLGEIIKYAFLADEKLHKYIFKNISSVFEHDNRVMERLITDSVKFKRDVVIADEKEKSLRKILNLGHTFAHAIETEQNYKIKHGAAVIIGIACSIYLSHNLGLLSLDQRDQYITSIKPLASRLRVKSYDKNKLIRIMKHDKKNKGNKIKFVLPQETGKVLIDVDADRKSINKSLDQGLKLFT